MIDKLWGLFAWALIILLPSAWVTHIVVCLDTERWGFLLAGAIMFPIAIIHGFMIWMGLS